MLSLVLCIFLSLTGISSAGYTPVQQDDTVKRSAKAPIRKDTLARFVKINRIFILGNKTTHERIILRELTLHQGDIIYSSDLSEILETDRKKLINTRLFNTVNIRTLELEKDQFDLLVDLKERWYTFPVPIFELADRNFNEWWQNYNHDFKRVNYGLRLYRYNMRGRNETLRFIAQFGYQKNFQLYYRIPNLDKEQKHGLAFDFDFSEVKNAAVRTIDHKLEYLEHPDEIIRVISGGGITYQFRNSFYLTHSFKVDFRSVQIADTIIKRNPDYLGGENINSQKFASLSYQFTSDRRDYVAYPLHGYYFHGNIIKTGLTPKDDVDKIENNLTFAKFFDLKRNFYLSSITITYLSSPNKLPYFNYGALGYRKQFIQGYEVYLIEGPAFFVNKLTLKKRLFSQVYHFDLLPAEQFRHIPIGIYLKTYANIGYVKNYQDYENGKRLTNKLLSSFGTGLDIVSSYDIVLRLEYTFNSEGENGFFLHLKKEF